MTVTKKDLTDSPTDNDLNTAFAFQKKQLHNYAVLLLNKIVTLQLNLE